MIVKVEGSWMHPKERGVRIEMRNVGCLEDDLQTRVAPLFRTGKVETVQFDLNATEDFAWRHGVGRNGNVTGFMRNIDDDLQLGIMI